MKKIILFLVLFISCVYAQDVSTVVYDSFYRDTLTTTIDTADVKFQNGFNYYTITAYTASGYDTINVYTKQEGNYGIYTQKALIDLSTNNIVTQIIVTTTPKEFLLQEPNAVHIRLVTLDGSANVIFNINAKKGNYSISGQKPLTSSDEVTANISNSSDWIVSSTVYSDTVKCTSETRTDTLSIGGSEWAKITINGLASTDSLLYAVGTTAPTTFRKIIGTTPIQTGKLNKTNFTKVFIRAFGAVNAIRSYQVIIEAF